MPAIRTERPEDVAAIREVVTACFPSDAEARLVEALRLDGALVVSLVAVEHDVVVGHVAFSPVTAESGARGVGLAPLAVVASHRRRGIGEALCRAGLDACARAGFGWAVVLGDPRYYGRFGFRPAAPLGLRDAYGGGNAFAVLELVPGALAAASGLVRYDDAFAKLG